MSAPVGYVITQTGLLGAAVADSYDHVVLFRTKDDADEAAAVLFDTSAEYVVRPVVRYRKPRSPR